jgi:FG-GAP-like repeat
MLKHILFATLLVGCAIEDQADEPDEPATTRTTEQAVTGSDTLQEYAAKCDAAVGLHVPAFNCDATGAASPDGQTTNGAGKCATPNVLNHACDPGSKFQVLAQNADASIVAHCRKQNQGAGFFGDIAVIQYNKKTGATCFYQALLSTSGAPLPGNVRPPSEGSGTYPWQQPSQTHNQACTGCHDNGAFIRSPYLAQLTGPHALPSTAQGYDNNTTPVKWVGLDFANDRSWSITRQGDATCTTCHRLAVSTFGNGIGTGTKYALEATSDDFVANSTDPTRVHGHPAKLPHGPLTATTSPMWMLKGQTAFSPTNFNAAQAIADCGKAFRQFGFATSGCGITPLGDAYSPGITNGGDDIIAFTSSFEGAGIAVGFSNGSGSFAVTNSTADWFANAAKSPGVQRVTGDFNKDGRTDIALMGGQGWNTVPIAFSNGDGTFSITNNSVGPDFNNWSRAGGAKPYVGDFNNDGYSDIALAGVGTWASIPIAFAWGGGTWNVTNNAAGSFPSFTAATGAKVYVGDYNKDGYSDLAVMGNTGWTRIPVAFASGGGNWQITQGAAPNVNQLMQGAHVTALVGDFNKDGYSDIALTGGAGWNTIPVAFASGGGSWQVTNFTAGDFGAWSSTPSSKPLVGDFNKDGYSDIALTGVSGWASIPVAMAAGGGTWQVTNQSVGWDFPAWSGTTNVRSLAGDFNGDGYTDIALTGGNWSSIPVALNTGFGNFSINNNPSTYMPSVTTDPNATVVVGRAN